MELDLFFIPSTPSNLLFRSNNCIVHHVLNVGNGKVETKNSA